MPSAKAAAAHIDVNPARFAELVDEGVIVGRSNYDLATVRQAYIRHLRQLAVTPTLSGDLDPMQGRARRDRAEALAASIQNHEVGLLLSKECSMVRKRLLSITTLLNQWLADASFEPGGPVGEFAGTVVRLVDQEIHSAIAELSADETFAAAAG